MLNWATRSTTSNQHIMLIVRTHCVFCFVYRIRKFSYDRISNRIQNHALNNDVSVICICLIFNSFIAHIESNWNEWSICLVDLIYFSEQIREQNSRKMLKNNRYDFVPLKTNFPFDRIWKEIVHAIAVLDYKFLFILKQSIQFYLNAHFLWNLQHFPMNLFFTECVIRLVDIVPDKPIAAYKQFSL